MDGSPVQAALSSIRAAVDDLNNVALWSRSNPAALDDVREGWCMLQAIEAAWLGLVADLEGRVLSEGLTTKAFLRSALRRTTGQASADVRAAMNRLPRVDEAFAAGEISRVHMDVITRTVERIPERVKHREMPRVAQFDPVPVGGDAEGETVIVAVDAFFALRARQYDSYQLQCLAKALLAALDPNGDDGFDPLAYERRGESHARDEAGLLHATMVLDPANAADYLAAIDHFSAPVPRRTEQAEDGSTVEIRDTRSAAQRRADAVGLIARLAMSAAEAGTKGGEPPRVVLYTGIEDYRDAHCTDPTHHHQPATPESSAPESSAPEPSTREPSTPELSAPEPSAPEPSAPEPSAPESFDRGPAEPASAVPQSTHDAPTEPAVPGLAATDSTPADVTRIDPPSGEPAMNDAWPREPTQASAGAGVAGVGGRWLWGRMHGATDTHLGPVGFGLLARFSCDAVLQVALMHPTGAILNLGRDARTISAAQRRALTARDRGCVIPGCTAPGNWCHGHHVTWWEHGGLTNLDELALVCGQHHTAVHLGLWTLKMINGVPWARPIEHIDPQRRWVRNTYHEDLDNVRGFGTQLRLGQPSTQTAPTPTTPTPTTPTPTTPTQTAPGQTRAGTPPAEASPTKAPPTEGALSEGSLSEGSSAEAPFAEIQPDKTSSAGRPTVEMSPVEMSPVEMSPVEMSPTEGPPGGMSPTETPLSGTPSSPGGERQPDPLSGEDDDGPALHDAA